MRRLFVLVIVLSAIAGPAPVAAAQHESAVQARVYVEQPSPCLTLDGALADFGVAQFSTPTTWNAIQGSTSTVTNCSGAAIELVARTTKAVNGTATVSWTPVNINGNTCNTGVNTFQHVLFVGTGAFFLDEMNQTVLPPGYTLSDGESAPFQHHLGMPCVGSDGNNDALTWTVTFTAVMP